LVERQTLDVIIRRNTDIGDELQENAFLIQPECVADVNHDGVLTPADFSAWVSAFNEQEPECDQNQDGQCTAADYAAWVANYNAGC
ncbi:MAG: GC-type dockerin domain-anchored protein, partial [Phycisphaerales bacterium JB061]